MTDICVFKLSFFNLSDYSEWGMYYPEASGSKQSPIDIVSNNAVFDQSLADRSLKFNYCSSRETEIMNNGYTVVVYPRSKQGNFCQQKGVIMMLL